MQGSDYDGYRPLLYACKHDKMFIVEWLLNETKANTNVHTLTASAFIFQGSQLCVKYQEYLHSLN